MTRQSIITHEEAEERFQLPEGKTFWNHSGGWVEYYHLGSLNGLPACKVDTIVFYPGMYTGLRLLETTTATEAVSDMIQEFEGQSATLVYPLNYQNLRNDRDMASMYVIAENADDLCKAMMLFKIGGMQDTVCNIIRSDYK